mgnify:CR=1 FL=1
MLKKYTKFLDGLESVEKVFLVVTAAIMVIVIAYQVVLRYVFHASNAWSEELARYLFIYDVFIGSAIALRKNSHLQVDVFLNLMKERTKYIYTIIVTILGILFLAVLFVYSISLCKISAVNITPGLQVSMAIPYACMPLGAVLKKCGKIKTMQERSGCVNEHWGSYHHWFDYPGTVRDSYLSFSGDFRFDCHGYGRPAF